MGKNNHQEKLEAKLDKGIRELIGRGPEDYSPEDWRSLRERLRLQVLYPGRFVAVRDHYHGKGDNRRLVQRQIVASSTSLPALQKKLRGLSEAENDDICVDYVDPPGPPRFDRFFPADGRHDS
jgi:hypothetical protein